MKRKWQAVGVGLCSTLLGCVLSQAQFFSFQFNSGFENGGTITDGSVVPWTDTRSISVPSTRLLKVELSLQISGGYNGDLYAYLSHGGVMVPLLNRVGVSSSNPMGYDDAGMDVVFSDNGSWDIHFYREAPSGTIWNGSVWQPDGRTIPPLSSPSDFDSANRVALSAFNGLDPNGDWTLVIADVVVGGGDAKVTQWGLKLETAPVPEPSHIALCTSLVLGLAGLFARWNKRRRKIASSGSAS